MLADVADECIHLMTTAFCSICKAQTRAAETRRRRNRAATHPSWETEDGPLPYPSTIAGYPLTCPMCDERYDAGITIYKCDGAWVDRACAEDCVTLGVGADG